MALDAEDLLRILLILVIVWVALEIATGFLKFFLGGLFALLKPLIGVLIVALIVLWLLDRL